MLECSFIYKRPLIDIFSKFLLMAALTGLTIHKRDKNIDRKLNQLNAHCWAMVFGEQSSVSMCRPESRMLNLVFY